MTGRLHAIVFFLLIAAATADRRGWEISGEGGDLRTPFKLEKSETVVKTEGGEIRVFAAGHPLVRRWIPMHIGFITMEPETLLIPHYIDANLIIFLRRGEGKIGWIHKDNLVERRLKPGDVLRIPAGSAFYLVNIGKGQQLQIICSFDRVEASAIDDSVSPYQSFFIGGGEYPRSVLAGFDISTLTSAFNATSEEVGSLRSARVGGPIVFLTGEGTDRPHQIAEAVRSAMGEFKQRKWLRQDDGEGEGEREGVRKWAAGVLRSIFLGFGSNCEGAAAEENKAQRRGGGEAVKAPDAYNIYDRDPDFRNKFGWSVELNEHDYDPLKESDISVFFVNLTAGSMVAPHVNPRATEYGIVIAGAGTVEVVYPNGTQAVKAAVKEGDVFCVPRFFPFCQTAAREGPMEILGFTTSSRRNRPQFLAGASSILRAMMGPELAAGFGLPEEKLRRLAMAQNESVILPSSPETEERE
ncbi:Vicilin-like antimicrobial peptides 2-2 [Platanthera guangdongensis]|uniref:Vicilin-like antimicrobial peptides 2-2 n=1 Tax=Platanthera guangdongensis TaxID=2320717 RepID=A0ABR2LW15_9ASPA